MDYQYYQWLLAFQSVCLMFSVWICMRCVIRMGRALDDLRWSIMRIEMAARGAEGPAERFQG